MSYIMPNAEVRILKAIPFENNYEHTILFEGDGDQRAYFNAHRKVIALDPEQTVTYTDYTYQRSNKNKIRIGIPIEKVIDCNYMMFKNTSFENKWFYAFITQIDYINNNCTELTYEIDVMQTYMFDYSLQECYVEREHSETDEPGDNTVPENLDVGDYIYTSIGKSFDAPNNGYTIDIVAPYKINLLDLDPIEITYTTDPPMGFYNNLFSGLYHNYYEITDYAGAWEFFTAMGKLLEDKKEQIVAIYTIPNILAVPESNMLITTPTNVITKNFSKNYSWTYDGNNPVKNKKLYTFPFNCMMIQSSDGETAQYKYELFSDSGCLFDIFGVIGTPPELLCCPVGYASGEPTDSALIPMPKEYVNVLSIKNFPMSGWNTDGFKAWLAQTATGLIGGAIGVAAAGAIGGALGVGIEKFTKMSYAANVYGSVSNLPKAIIAPNYAHGVNKNSVYLALSEFGYHFYNAHVKPEYAAIIDDYFNKFGYATKRVKKPNINSRPYWNYIETKNCNINHFVEISPSARRITGFNAEDTRKISDIYDHGITFWHYRNGSVDVGNYDQDNSPLQNNT